jgi:hypothetical protein
VEAVEVLKYPLNMLRCAKEWLGNEERIFEEALRDRNVIKERGLKERVFPLNEGS